MKSLTYAHNICTSTNPYKLYVQLMSLLYNGVCKYDNVTKINDLMRLLNHDANYDVKYYYNNIHSIKNVLKKFCKDFIYELRLLIKFDEVLVGNEIEINILDNINYSKNKYFGFGKKDFYDIFDYLYHIKLHEDYIADILLMIDKDQYRVEVCSFITKLSSNERYSTNKVINMIEKNKPQNITARIIFRRDIGEYKNIGLCFLKEKKLRKNEEIYRRICFLYTVWCFIQNINNNKRSNLGISDVHNIIIFIMKSMYEKTYYNKIKKISFSPDYIDLYTLFKDLSYDENTYYFNNIITVNSTNLNRKLSDSLLQLIELNTEYEPIINIMFNQPNVQSTCNAIDEYMEKLFEGKRINEMPKILDKLVLMFLIDKYPIDSIYNYDSDYMVVIQRVYNEIQKVCKNNIPVSTKILIADYNYKASIMRNVGMELCDTEWMTFSDDDDFRCSILEFVDMVNLKIKENEDLFLFSLPARMFNGEHALTGMWRIVLKPAMTRLIFYNNPPFLMQGEDTATWEMFSNLKILKNKYIDLEYKIKSDDIVAYIYLNPSQRYKDGELKFIHKHAYSLILDEIYQYINSGLLKENLRGIFINYNELKELFKTVHSYDLVRSFKYTTLKQLPVLNNYYAFVTNRPSKKDNEHSTLPIKITPREATINHDTGIVTYNGKKYNWENWNVFIDKNYMSYAETLLPKLEIHTGKSVTIKKMYKNIDVKKEHPVTQMYGGKHEIIINIMLLIFSAILIIFIISVIVYYIRSRCKNKNCMKYEN